MSVIVILSFCFVLDLKDPAHLDCRLLRRMRRRYWRVNPKPYCTTNGPGIVQTQSKCRVILPLRLAELIQLRDSGYNNYLPFSASLDFRLSSALSFLLSSTNHFVATCILHTDTAMWKRWKGKDSQYTQQKTPTENTVMKISKIIYLFIFSFLFKKPGESIQCTALISQVAKRLTHK